MDTPAFLDVVTAELDRFATAATAAGPNTDVPTCPGWSVSKLVKHAGTVLAWGETIVRERRSETLPFRALDLGLPDDPAAYPQWLVATGARFVDTLRSTPPDTPVWTWGPGATAAFWARRMAHELTVHRVDAQLAGGAAAGELAIDPAVASDGIDEFLYNLTSAASFAPNVAELTGAGETLHVHCTDVEGEWLITLSPNGFEVTHGHAKGNVALRGPAATLLLVLYRRLPLATDGVDLFGDAALAQRWFDGSAI